MTRNTFKAAIALAAVLLIPVLSGCGKASASTETANINDSVEIKDMTNPTDTASVRLLVETSLGQFTILLYGDTPQHRDNFVKLANDGFYEGTLFHRIINRFMIQAGDPDSKTAQPGQRLGAGGPGYTIAAEIDYPRHYHKRYALAAARQGDQVNPERRSSGSQFYIVTGQRPIPAQLEQYKGQMKNIRMQQTFNALAQEHMDEIRAYQASADHQGISNLRDSLIAQTEEIVSKITEFVPQEIIDTYTQIGGTPHLDGQYTVFGEVIDGFETIDKIEKVETDASDRPKEDVRIISVKVIKSDK